MNFFVAGEDVRLIAVLGDGVTGLFPQAEVYLDGVTLETTIDLNDDGDGRYSALWSPADTDALYLVVYVVYSDAGHTLESLYGRDTEQWRSVDSTGSSIAAAVWDATAADHVAAGTTGEMLAKLSLIEKIQRNRLELEDGHTGNWVLYDDDGTSPLLTWNVRDKTGAAIAIEASVPARRNRGV